MLENTLRSLHHQLRTDLHQAVMHIPRSIVGPDAHLVAQNYSSCIYILVYHESSHAGDTLAVDYRPVDRSGPAVLRQQCGVKIESAKLGHAPDFLRKHAESHHHEQIRLPCGELLQEFRILEFKRLQHRKPMLHRILLDRRLMHLEPAPAGLVRHCNHSYHLISRFHQCIERSHGELGRTHEYYPCGAEETHHPALEFAPVVHKRIVAEKSCVLYGARSEIGAYRPQDKGGDERPQRGSYGTIPREFRARDVHHPVEHEE